MKDETEKQNDATTASTESGGETEKPAQNKDRLTKSKSAEAYDILNELDRWQTPTGRKFVNIDGAAVPLRRSEQLKEYVCAEYRRRNHDTISESAIEQAVLAISGEPMETREVPVRIGGDETRISVDLVADNNVAVVTPEGVTIEPNRGAFVRPPGTASLKVAELRALGAEAAAAAFAMFFALLGIADVQSKAALVAFLIQAMRPMGPFAMLMVRGPQGSGKTTLAREVRRLVDPRAPEDVELPHNTRYLAILAEHAHLLSFDNISIISQKLSDACCRLATGSGFVTRALRTDRELASFLISRPLFFTSIGDVAVAPDFLDRALLLTLPPRTARKSEQQLLPAFEELRPRLLAALLYSVHVALRNVASVEVSSAIRMMDAARFAVAAESATGLPPGSIEKAFLASRNDAALITSLDPVVSRSLDVLNRKNPWRGSLEELLDELHGPTGSSRARAVRDLPNNARALRDRLDRVSGALRHFGVSVDLSQLHSTYRTRIVVMHREVNSDRAVNGHAMNGGVAAATV